MIHSNNIFIFWLVSLVLNGDIIAGEYLFGSNFSGVGRLIHSTKELIKNIKTYQEHKKLQELALKEKKNNKHDDFNLPFNENIDCNLPFEDISVSNNVCNMPLDIVPSQLKKVCKAYPNIALSFKTSLLTRLFLFEREIFDVDGYHSVPVSLMQLMLQYGKATFEEKKKFYRPNDDVKMYRSYGLLYSMGSIKKGKLIEQFKPIQARLLTKSTKKIDDVIFHIGFERLEKLKKNIKNDKKLIKYCLSIDTLMIVKEKNKVWKHVLERKTPKTPFFININKEINTVPLVDMVKLYGPYFRKDDLFVFPCPNKNFFATTKHSITGSLPINA